MASRWAPAPIWDHQTGWLDRANERISGLEPPYAGARWL